ncbi:FUSC family protein [Novosphingobium sp. FSY-8]|uniref:FUSC family protein n=1 Tax=Novosphingobium ovatum TaxID=1908523 RepID=A0ABW9XCZ6_9SPHN|nr:FUSC family protein [Novosphingobium ovatum]NBC36347.1 FUSC family protein [Novosphingobium ovatum]
MTDTMPDSSPEMPIVARLRAEWAEITQIQSSQRPWQMPVVAGITSGLPVALGHGLGHMDVGVMAALGTMSFVYLGDTDLRRKLLTLMAVAFGLTLAFAVGAGVAALGGHSVGLGVPVVMVVAFAASVGCRYLNQGPPAAMFFTMAAAIGLFTGGDPAQLPAHVGTLFLGAALAVVTGALYSIYIVRRRNPRAVQAQTPPPLVLWFEPAMIALAAGVSLAAALALGIDKPFWAPVSCIAVIQAVSLRKVWTRHAHRVIGTVLGLGLAAGILALPLNGWSIALLIGGLTFLVEIVITRHYGLATVFITPLAILIAEAPRLGEVASGALIAARLYDTLVGCSIAVAFGMVMHGPRVRAWAARRLTPTAH